ncbi:Deoxyribose-phosphate aldolase [bacterium HR40]|nr:Deoxyribose-phosphate aldolase [bacterium HR40]
MLADPFAALEHVRGLAPDRRAASRLLPLLDVTSLRGDETEEEVGILAEQAVRYGCAAVCVLPRWLPAARAIVAGTGVRLATVANFPAGGDDLLAVGREVEAAIALGAEEIDVVAPLAAVRAGDVELVGELVQLCRKVAGGKATFKVILETGWLGDPALVTAAARAAVMGGADFLKTSTGKREPGATLEAAALLLAVIGEADGRVGLKIAGGLRRLADAFPYLALIERAMGPAWVTPQHVRFGASRLLDDLVAHPL